MKQLKIACTYNETLKLDELSDFQGHLKIRNDSDYKKIIKSIEKYGFSFPFFVWKNGGKNLVLDGHGRLRALQIMRESGTEIDDIPVVYVNVKNEKEAKDLLLRLNSQYGRMTKQSVMEFVGKDFDLNLDDFQLPAFSLDLQGPFESIDDYYKKQIQQKNYVPLERKRKSLEGVLVPITSKWNEELLRSCRFRVELFWRCLNFAG